MQTFIALLFLAAIVALIVKLHLLDRKETVRRAALSPEDRAALERADGVWSQQMSF